MRKTHLVVTVTVLAAMTLFAAETQAYYHPGMGRFLSRDPGPGGTMGAPRVGTAGPAVGGRFLPRDQYADGMNLYQYVGSEPIGWTDATGNARQRAQQAGKDNDKDKPKEPGVPAPGTPDFVGPTEPPAGRWATCGIKVYRSAICTLSPKKPSDFGHEWTNDGQTTWDYPKDYFSDPVHPCHKYDKEHPVWIWNAHVKPLGGSLPDGTSCDKASCRQIKACLQAAENEWDGTSYSFWGHNCIDFAQAALNKCCMDTAWFAYRIPGWGEEKKRCCEREREMDRLGCNGGGGP